MSVQLIRTSRRKRLRCRHININGKRHIQVQRRETRRYPGSTSTYHAWVTERFLSTETPPEYR